MTSSVYKDPRSHRNLKIVIGDFGTWFALTSLLEKPVTLVTGPFYIKNLDSAGEQPVSAAGSLGYVTQGIIHCNPVHLGPKCAYVHVCGYMPSPSDDVKGLV